MAEIAKVGNERHETQTKSTTEILVQPSGEIAQELQAQTGSAPGMLMQHSVQASGEILSQPSAPETSLSTKQRAGTNARRAANAADAGEHVHLPYAQKIAGSVLRQEEETPPVVEVVATTTAAVLRTEATPTAYKEKV